MLKTYLLATVLALSLSRRGGAEAQFVGCGASMSEAEVARLITKNLAAGTGHAPSFNGVTLQKSPAGFTFRQVCLASSGTIDLYRFVSLVAYYSVNGSSPAYEQFEFECVDRAWSATSTILQGGFSGTNRLTLADGAQAISTPLRTDCAYCLNPSIRLTDPTTHCFACVGCLQLNRCYISNAQGLLTISTTCCNVYLRNGTCSLQCPPYYAQDPYIFQKTDGKCEYNIFLSQDGYLLAAGIAVAGGLLFGLCCCCLFAIACCIAKAGFKRRHVPRVHKSPTFSEEKTVFTAELV